MMEQTKKAFNREVEKIIELMEHEFYTIQIKSNISCTCIQAGTNQGNPDCPKCLGTGRKIKIKKVRGASTDSGGPATMRNSAAFVTAKNYYIKSKDRLLNDDLIVDTDGVYLVYQGPDYATFGGEQVYQKCACVPKKLDTGSFMDNFNKIVGR